MFPLLRRTDSKNLKKLYLVLRGLFVPITYGLLLSFIPLKDYFRNLASTIHTKVLSLWEYYFLWLYMKVEWHF